MAKRKATASSKTPRKSKPRKSKPKKATRHPNYDGITHRSTVPLTVPELAEWSQRGFDVLGRIEAIEAAAWAIVEPYVFEPSPDDGCKLVMHQGQRFLIRADVSPDAIPELPDAQAVLLAVHQLRECLSADSPDAGLVAKWALDIGVRSTLMVMRSKGPAVLEGERSLGHVETLPTKRKKHAKEQRLAKRTEAEEAIKKAKDTLKEQGNLKPTKPELEKQAAEDLGITQRAIRNRLSWK